MWGIFVARIKVKPNECGLIPEFVDVIGNFEPFYVRIHPSTLPYHSLLPGDLQWKNTRTEKKCAEDIPCRSQTMSSHRGERLMVLVDSFPAKQPATTMGMPSASEFKSIDLSRGLNVKITRISG